MLVVNMMNTTTTNSKTINRFDDPFEKGKYRCYEPYCIRTIYLKKEKEKKENDKKNPNCRTDTEAGEQAT